MREVELLCYVDAFEGIKNLELESSEVREYLRHLRLLKTIDHQSLEALKEMVGEEDYQEICKIVGKAEKEEKNISYPFLAKKSHKNRQEKIVLTSPIIEEFEKVASNGTSSMEVEANLWDYRGEEVLLILKYSVARIYTLEGRLLFSVSGRPNFVERIAYLAGFDEESENQYYSSRSDLFLDEEQRAIKVVLRRVPKWLRDTEQKNSKILIAFLQTSNLNTTPIFSSLIEKNCDLDSKSFWASFNSMKNIKGTVGRVFEEKPNGTITLWQPVADFILQEYIKVFKP